MATEPSNPPFEPLAGEMQMQDGVYKRNVVAQNGLIVHAPVDAIGCGKAYCFGQPADGGDVEEPSECFDFSEGGQIKGTLQYIGGVLIDSNGIFDKDGIVVACFEGCGAPQTIRISTDGESYQLLADIEEIYSFEGPPTPYTIMCLGAA